MNNFSELGIQRVVVWLCNELSAGHYGNLDLSLVVHEASGPLRAYLSGGCKIIELDKEVTLSRIKPTIRRIAAYYKVVEREDPDVVLGVNQYEAMLLSIIKGLGARFKLIAAEHCNVTENLRDKSSHTERFRSVYRLWIPFGYNFLVDLVQTVSNDALEDLVTNFGLRRRTVCKIYNPVSIETVLERSSERCPQIRINGVIPPFRATMSSRLVRQKNVAFAVEGWSNFVRDAKVQPGAALLCIIGDGDERRDVERKVTELGMENYVRLVGFQLNPWKYMAESSVFISTSIWEGLPCSLIEAQVLGIPVIASDCRSGPNEILLSGKAGVLFPVGAMAAFVAALKRMYEDPQMRRNLADSGKRSTVRFDLRCVAQRYVEMFNGIRDSFRNTAV